jgi:tetratricopeptide (TPR) repeat protein
VEEGRCAEAAAAFEKAIENTGGMSLAVANLAYTYGQSGERAKARKLLREMETRSKEQYISPLALAVIHLGLGGHEMVFECLSRAYEERSALLPWVRTLPQYDGVRSDPRYQDLLLRMGLAP